MRSRDAAELERAGEREAADRDRHLHAVDEREALLGAEHDRAGSARGAERAAAGICAAARRGTLPSPIRASARCDSGARSPGGADGALRRDDGKDVGREHREQRLDRRDADAGVAAGERVGPQHHHRPHGRRPERRADARGVAADEVALELLDLSAAGSRRRRTFRTRSSRRRPSPRGGSPGPRRGARPPSRAAPRATGPRAPPRRDDRHEIVERPRSLAGRAGASFMRRRF